MGNPFPAPQRPIADSALPQLELSFPQSIRGENLLGPNPPGIMEDLLDGNASAPTLQFAAPEGKEPPSQQLEEIQQAYERPISEDPGRITFDQDKSSTREARAENPPLDYDAIVVGSGPGGSVAALRLAQAGKKVLVLERGQRYDYPEKPYPVGLHALWLPEKGLFGHHDIRFMARTVTFSLFGKTLQFNSKLLGHIIAWRGSGVGGGTHVWAKTVIRASREVLSRRFPKEIAPEILYRWYYPVVEDMLGATPYPNYAPYSEVPKTKLFQKMGELMKQRLPSVESFPLSLAIHFSKLGEPMSKEFVNRHGAMRRTYDLRETALLEGDWGTTGTTDSNYLAEAGKTGNVEIRALHEADKIEELPGGGYRIHAADRGDAMGPTGNAAKHVSFTAKKIFLAANSIGTTEILLRNAQIHKTLTRLSPKLGEKYGTNGDRLGLAFTKKTTAPDIGPTNTWAVEFPDKNGNPELIIMDGSYPNPLLMGTLGILDFLGIRSPKLAMRLCETLHRIQKKITGHLSRLFGVPLLGMNADYRSEGIIKLDEHGRAMIDIDMRANAEADRKMDSAMAMMGQTVESRRGILNWVNRFLSALPAWVYRWSGKVEVPHNMGGVPMGATPEEGVVNHFGKVHGYDCIYVTDGSILPPALGRNPTATLMAIAERSMTHILFGEFQRMWSDSLERILRNIPNSIATTQDLARLIQDRIDSERAQLDHWNDTGIFFKPEGRTHRSLLNALETEAKTVVGYSDASQARRFLEQLYRQHLQDIASLTPQKLEQN